MKNNLIACACFILFAVGLRAQTPATCSVQLGSPFSYVCPTSYGFSWIAGSYVKLDPYKAGIVNGTTADIASQVVGVVTGMVTANQAVVRTSGMLSMNFDGAVTTGDTFVLSTTIPGYVHDSGNSICTTSSLGIANQTIGSAGSASVWWGACPTFNASIIYGTQSYVTSQPCAPPLLGFANDATPGLNFFYCTSTNTWTQQAATNTVGGNQTATSYSTNGTPTGSLTVTAKTSGAQSVITAQDNNPTGGTLYVPVGGGTLAIGGSGAGGGQVNCSASTATANTTTYSGFSTCLPGTSKTTHAWYVTTTCTLQNFWFSTLTTQPSDGAMVASIIDLGASPTLIGSTPTTLTVTVAASATDESLSDTTHTYQAVAGHFLILQLVNASMSASAEILGWGVTCQ
jgi:hypothetical protein